MPFHFWRRGKGPQRPPLNMLDNIELSPWEKYSYYDIFPWKMCLHIILVVLVTAQANLVNEHYASYTRAVGRNFVNLFFPDAESTPDVAGYSYHIYTINDTIADAHQLLVTYFQLPEVSVDLVNIAGHDGQDCSQDAKGGGGRKGGSGSCGIPFPIITMNYHGQRQEYLIINSSSPWPLQVGGQVDQWVQNDEIGELRNFFDKLSTITFSFVIKSEGWGGGVDRNREVCLVWGLNFKYDLTFGGQFLVTVDYAPKARCTKLHFTDRYIIMCLFIGLLAIIYQILLLKATFIKLQLMKYLHARSRRRSSAAAAAAAGGGGGEKGGEGGGDPASVGGVSGRTPSSLGPERDHPYGFTSPPLGGRNERQPLLTEGRRGGGGGRGYSSLSPTPMISPTDMREISVAIWEGENEDEPTTAGTKATGYQAEGEKVTWEDLSWSDKLQLFNLWNVVSTLGNVCALAYTVRGISMKIDIMTDFVQRTLVGVACLMLWIAVVQYLEFNPRYYVMILTLKKAVPRIGQFMVGILPCFFGYALLGTILFGDRNIFFSSLSATMGTLLCVLNGDSIKVVFDSITYMPVVGELYICTYMMLFMYVCLMTCLAIVEEAFFSSAEVAHELWAPSNAEEDVCGSGQQKGEEEVDRIGGFVGGGLSTRKEGGDGDRGDGERATSEDEEGRGRRRRSSVNSPSPIVMTGGTPSSSSHRTHPPPAKSMTPLRPTGGKSGKGPGSVFEPPLMTVSGSLSPPPASRSASASPAANRTLTRSRSGRYMSTKLRHFLDAAALNELESGPGSMSPPVRSTWGGRIAGGGGGGRKEGSHLSSRSSRGEQDDDFGGGGGGQGGGGRAMYRRRSFSLGEESEEGGEEERYLGQVAVDEALSELQTLLLREIARQARSSGGEGGGGGLEDADGGQEEEAAVILKAISTTKKKILQRRTSTPVQQQQQYLALPSSFK